MTEGEKEQLKLRAAYFNGLAIAVAAVGGVAIAAAIYTRPESVSIAGLIMLFLAPAISGALHMHAYQSLRKIDDQ